MAGSDGIKIIDNLTQKLKSFFFSKDILSFLLFLILSAGFWFLHALDKERENTITVHLKYVGIPHNITFTNQPPTEIVLNVKDQGINLLSYSTHQLKPLEIDLSQEIKKNRSILITPEQLKSKVQRHLLQSTKVFEVFPNSIFIECEKLCVKTVPIQLVSQIQLAHQCMLSGKVRLNPNKVTIYGPKKVLKTIKTVYTDIIKVNNLNDTCILTCKLQSINQTKFSKDKTSASIFVEPFTEKKVQFPITSLNVPNHLSIRTFPALVSLTYNVGLSHFNEELTSDQLKVYVDYNDLNPQKNTKQRLDIINNTSFISNIRISPDDVEFIIEEK